MTLTISVGTSRRSTNWQPKDVTWTDLCTRMATPKVTAETMAEFAAMARDARADIKDVGGFVGGRVQGGNRKAGSVTERQIVCLDADFGDESLLDVWQMMVGCDILMHSTHSSTPDKPRLRFLIPLCRPVSEAEYEPIARKLAEMMDIEAFDDTTYEASRLMYWPSVPSDAQYVFACEDTGNWVDPDEILAEYSDWRDMRNWPLSSRQEQIIRKMGEKQGDPLLKPGVIGAFNRAYRISQAIERFLPGVYLPAGGDRYTYAEGTTQGGAVVYDDDTFIYSHHDTDPISGRLCSAYDMVRLHLYGQLDTDKTVALGDLPSTAAMKTLCSGDPDVRAELADAIKTRADDVFHGHDDGLKTFTDDLTEQGMAKEFADMYARNVRSTRTFGWMFWDGQRWVPDAEPEVFMLGLQFADDKYAEARLLMQTAADKGAQERAKALLRSAVKLRSASGMGNVLRMAKNILNDPHPQKYDSDAWTLNTPAGIVDLRTGALRPHDQAVGCTKISTCSPGPQGAEMWAGFIDHITGGDKEFARYLQTLAGMAAVGEVYEEGLVIAYGPGGNGKSTFFGALHAVLGDYAKTSSADMLVVSGSSRVDQSFVATLRGVRLAIMGETEEGAHFGVAEMKRITSRDRIIARQLYKDPIEFVPVHTVVMHTNHLPKLNSLDGGTKRRIAVAPFPGVLPPEKVIKNYEAMLVEQAGPAIMQWIVDGAVMFSDAGHNLVKPSAVQKATRDYIAEEDWLARFIQERCVAGEGLKVGARELLLAYQAWGKMEGEYVRSRTAFNAAVAVRGFEKKKLETGWYWMGLGLADDL